MAETLPPWETDPQAAYAVAQRRIAAWQDGHLGLSDLTALDRLPPEIGALITLPGLFLGFNRDGCAVTDLTPLQGLTGRQRLYLNDTQVTDLTPLMGLTLLQALYFDNTQVADLRPIREISSLIEAAKQGDIYRPGLRFRNTPAARADPELTRLSEIQNHAERTEATLAYLHTLPAPPSQNPPDPEPEDETTAETDDLPLTVEAVLEAQDMAGWRYVQRQGALDLFVLPTPDDTRRIQMAEMTAKRLSELQKLLRTANSPLPRDVLQEADYFATILADTTRPLSERAPELWGSLISLGSKLEANDTALAQGRDPLDYLKPEDKAALQTLLVVASTLVRSFPDIRAMDEEQGGFFRARVTSGLILTLLQAAIDETLIAEPSARVIQHVADVGQAEGDQADKAQSVTATGTLNLVRALAVLARSTQKGVVLAAAGLTAGATGAVGVQLAEDFAIYEKTKHFVERNWDAIEALLKAAPPDEGANLRSTLRDLRANSSRR